MLRELSVDQNRAHRKWVDTKINWIGLEHSLPRKLMQVQQRCSLSHSHNLHLIDKSVTRIIYSHSNGYCSLIHQSSIIDCMQNKTLYNIVYIKTWKYQRIPANNKSKQKLFVNYYVIDEWDLCEGEMIQRRQEVR